MLHSNAAILNILPISPPPDTCFKMFPVGKLPFLVPSSLSCIQKKTQTKALFFLIVFQMIRGGHLYKGPYKYKWVLIT